MIALVLPVLFPSWRFFRSVEPSPRVEWTQVSKRGVAWRTLRRRPARRTPYQQMFRLFWNPDGNEDLFLVSCAERLQAHPTAHSIDVIRGYVRRAAGGADDRTPLQFRLVMVRREENALLREVVYLSDVFAARAPR